MITSLDDSFDSHWAYVYQYQKTTVNIIIQARIDKSIPEISFLNAIKNIQLKHPYLSGKLKSKTKKNKRKEFYLEIFEGAKINHSINNISQSNLNERMEKISPNLRKVLDLEKGELLNINLYSTKNESIIEFVCAHLIGDATAILLLMKEFLFHLDGKNKNSNPKEQKRLPFDEIAYRWATEKTDIHPMPLPKKIDGPNDWPKPKIKYKRFNLKIEKFKKIQELLKNKKIKAKTSDFFYYIAAILFSEENKDLSTVQSFRKKLKKEKNNINTSVAFKLINIEKNLINEPKAWMEEFYSQRKSALDKIEILGLINFLRSLNLSLNKSNLEQGKSLLFNLVPINAFAFNNIGPLDQFFDGHESFNVIDVNYQDATPGEFFRMYGFKDKIYMSPIFYEGGKLNCNKFWMDFNKKMDEILLFIKDKYD